MAENNDHGEEHVNDVDMEETTPSSPGAPPAPESDEADADTPSAEPEAEAPAEGDSSAAPPADANVIKTLKPEDQIKLYVWAGEDDRCLGDDVHCQQVFMILTLKSEVNPMARFQVITESMNIRKSPEFSKLAVNKLPCLVDPVADRVISDVQTIVDYLEQVFTEPRLIPTKSSLGQVGIDLYRKFTGYLKNRNPNKEGEMRNALNRELEKLNRALVESSGKFLDGDHLTQPDLRLLPRLHHIIVAGKIFKGYEIPEDESKYGKLTKYLEDWKQEEVYQNTKFTDKDLEYGWYRTRGLDNIYIKSKGAYKLKP